MDANVEIRVFKSEDVNAVVGIQEAIIQRKVAPDWLNLVRLQLAKEDAVSLIAEKDGEVIGFFFGEIKHGHYGVENSGWIEMFGVNPKHMGEGVGRALASEAFNRFKGRGVTEIYTAVKWDFGDLLAFFKKIGFSLSDFISLKTTLE
jgi:GNAT superfamily N-acetyltransferase